VTIYTAPIGATAVGAVAADAFLAAGFNNPVGGIFNTGGDFWLRGATERYFKATDQTKFAISTVSSFRDVEVELWGRVFSVYMRADADGRHIRFNVNEEADILEVTCHYALVNGPIATNHSGLFDPFKSPIYAGDVINTDLTTYPGYIRANAAGRSYTFGVSGFDLYIKLNGVEVFRGKQWMHLKAGKVIIQQEAGYGVTDFVVTSLTDATLFSDLINEIYDPRDWGLKSTLTTGSMTSGSPTLTVASSAGFAVGDRIIVEIGAESIGTAGVAARGAGNRGTKGVGGQWPALQYATEALRNADTGQTEWRWSWAVDTGIAKWWDPNISNTWHKPDQGVQYGFHWQLALPMSLRAFITNIVGNVLTLDTAASATVTNANVHSDNADIMQWMARDFLNAGDLSDHTFYTPAKQISVPTGHYAMWGGLQFTVGRLDWQIYGAGMDSTRLFSPKGAWSIICSCTQCDRTKIHDMELQGNFVGAGDGYLFNSLGGYLLEVSQGWPQPLWGYVVDADLSHDCEFYNIRVRDVFPPAFHGNFAFGLYVHDCEVIIATRPYDYMGWYLQIADTSATVPSEIVVFENCSLTLPYLYGGFECFRSSGSQFINCTSVNGIWSSNASGNFLFDNSYTIMTENSELSYIDAYGTPIVPSIVWQNPVMQANSNIHPPNPDMALGGIYRNPTIIVEGPLNAAGDGPSSLIAINVDNPNISVIGDPPWVSRPCGSPLEGGYFSTGPLSSGHDIGACAVNTDGDNTIVNGIRVDGETTFNKNVRSASATTLVENCVFGKDAGVNGYGLFNFGTETGNMTFAEWEALMCYPPLVTLGSVLHTHVMGKPKIVMY
jgi:hypothetical protein